MMGDEKNNEEEDGGGNDNDDCKLGGKSWESTLYSMLESLVEVFVLMLSTLLLFMLLKLLLMLLRLFLLMKLRLAILSSLIPMSLLFILLFVLLLLILFMLLLLILFMLLSILLMLMLLLKLLKAPGGILFEDCTTPVYFCVFVIILIHIDNYLYTYKPENKESEVKIFWLLDGDRAPSMGLGSSRDEDTEEEDGGSDDGWMNSLEAWCGLFRGVLLSWLISSMFWLGWRKGACM